MPCGKCFSEGHLNVHTEVDLTDNGVYEVICENGHKTTDMIKNEKYELLYDLAIIAVSKGFSREAVSSFAASFERFHEFAIKVMLAHLSIQSDEVMKTWKLVSAQSERQLGAFYFLYLSSFKVAPMALDAKQVKFRNNVIHKGYIPSEDEVLNYAEAIFQNVINTTTLLKRNMQKSMNLISVQKKEEFEKRQNRKVSFFSIGTTLNHDVPIEILEKDVFNYEKSVYYLTKAFPLYVK